ncbi:hypothetical protein BEN47_06145 [Hymenobacter lapidarius]|uniref:Uncharacterized protein n=1 Tax=Hymenobacter lapidarius TaxID=1908237 RepID=A0A1G1SQD5_9BACT|nr:hypothetical protein [Hymenobacter lapidarius]OGX80835.1 hypothetical protein BEN47_06145 [Hymenobacter lapidarius]
MNTPIIPEIITPEPDATSFTAKGVTYTMFDGLLTGRSRFYDRLSIEFGLDTKLPGIIDGLDTLKASFNKLDFVKAASTVELLRQGINIIGANRVREVEIVGMFFNAPEEDPSKYDFAAMQAKCYGAWEGVHSGFFLLAAIRCMKTGYGSYAHSLTPAGLTPASLPQPSE